MEITKEKLLDIYRTMKTIREFEIRGVGEVAQRALTGSVHSSAGEEAVSTGVCSHLRQEDYIASTHRGHGHCIAKGVDPKLMMAELFGKSIGTNEGKGGSMHIADMSRGMLGANGIVAGGVPLAVGAALSAYIQGKDLVAVAFFGDGGANQGVLHESMNLAAIWKLPVIFVCENNIYAESTPVDYATSVEKISDRAAAYSMPGETVDGMDVLKVYDSAGEAVGRARAGQGPTLLEFLTYRYYGHTAMDNPLTYRTKEEEQEWRARDPLILFRKNMEKDKLLKSDEMNSIDTEVADLIEDAVKLADDSPLPEKGELLTNVYVDYPQELLTRGTHLEI